MHLCTGKGAKGPFINVENFVFDIYHNFRKTAKLKKAAKGVHEH